MSGGRNRRMSRPDDNGQDIGAPVAHALPAKQAEGTHIGNLIRNQPQQSLDVQNNMKLELNPTIGQHQSTQEQLRQRVLEKQQRAAGSASITPTAAQAAIGAAAATASASGKAVAQTGLGTYATPRHDTVGGVTTAAVPSSNEGGGSGSNKGDEVSPLGLPMGQVMPGAQGSGDLFTMAQTARRLNPELMKYDSFAIVNGLRKLTALIPTLPAEHELRKNPKSINVGILIKVIETGTIPMPKRRGRPPGSKTKNRKGQPVNHFPGSLPPGVDLPPGMMPPSGMMPQNMSQAALAAANAGRGGGVQGPFTSGVDLAVSLGLGSTFGGAARDAMLFRQISNAASARKTVIEADILEDMRESSVKLHKPDLTRLKNVEDLLDRLMVYHAFPHLAERNVLAEEEAVLAMQRGTSESTDENAMSVIVEPRLKFLEEKDAYRHDTDVYDAFVDAERAEEERIIGFAAATLKAARVVLSQATTSMALLSELP